MRHTSLSLITSILFSDYFKVNFRLIQSISFEACMHLRISKTFGMTKYKKVGWKLLCISYLVSNCKTRFWNVLKSRNSSKLIPRVFFFSIYRLFFY